jgi:hypothetical protein
MVKRNRKALSKILDDGPAPTQATETPALEKVQAQKPLSLVNEAKKFTEFLKKEDPDLLEFTENLSDAELSESDGDEENDEMDLDEKVKNMEEKVDNNPEFEDLGDLGKD